MGGALKEFHQSSSDQLLQQQLSDIFTRDFRRGLFWVFLIGGADCKFFKNLLCELFVAKWRRCNVRETEQRYIHRHSFLASASIARR